MTAATERTLMDAARHMLVDAHDEAAAIAQLAEEAIVCWRRFGKGRHRASLNFGDTFSYALARQLGQPLVFVGDDFAHTDVEQP